MDMRVRGFGAGATRVTIALVAGFAVSVGIALASAQTAGRSVWDGAFSAAQAERGKTTYVAECSGCHLETLLGDGGASPALIGKVFVEEWDKKTVKDLYSRIRNTMPATNPGGLSDQAYVDITAYLLQMNKFPEGTADLPPNAEALTGVLIQVNKP